jgi:hypothetical protein
VEYRRGAEPGQRCGHDCEAADSFEGSAEDNSTARINTGLEKSQTERRYREMTF